ncbi:hypothetical protein QTP88_018070 [Uroleucon formosanum]
MGGLRTKKAENDQRRTVFKIIIFMLIVCVIVAVTILFVIRSPTNHSSTEDLRLLTVNSESQSMGDTIHDGRFKVRRSKVFGTTWTPAIDKSINRYDYSNMERNKLAANQYGSNSYRNSYDPMYNDGVYSGFKQNYGKVIGIPGSNIINGPGFGVNYSPANGPYNWPMENTPIIDHYKHITHLPTSIPNTSTLLSMTSEHQSQIPQNKIVILIPKDFLIDWRKIGIIALGKLILVKLKAFSVIKILFFLMFKLKLIMLICAFKFILLLTFIKFFKVLLPLFLLPLFLIMLLSPLFFISIYSIPERIVQLLRMPMSVPATPLAIPAPVSAPSNLALSLPAPNPPAPRPPAPSPPAPSPPAPSPPAPSPPAPPISEPELLTPNRQ